MDCVQIREKDAAGAELLAWIRQVQALCRPAGVPVIVNDRVETALAAAAAGVHLGQEDMHPSDARKLAGGELWIGWSTHDLEQLDEAAELGVDYAGFGPIFATETKGYREGLGAEHLAAALAIARVPVVAIGGIRPENAWMIPAQAGVAVASALATAEDPAKVARALLSDRV